MWNLRIDDTIDFEEITLTIKKVIDDNESKQKYLGVDKHKQLYIITLFKDGRFDWIITRLNRRFDGQSKTIE